MLQNTRHKAVILAFLDGKDVEWRVDNNHPWEKINTAAAFNECYDYRVYDYRVKPKNIEITRSVWFEHGSIIISFDNPQHEKVKFIFSPEGELISVEKI